MSTLISMDDIHRVENGSSPTPKRRSVTKTFDVLIITLSDFFNHNYNCNRHCIT
jgi:hypothetical protein